MNIPIDRLYHYIESVAEKILNDRIVIYRFWPHGSKNINNLNPLRHFSHYDRACAPHIYCNDQEPLNFDYYETDVNEWSTILEKYNLKKLKNLKKSLGIFDQCVLLHSEQRGDNLKKYCNDSNFVPAYYWSHAVIARDWFRFAEHVTQKKKVQTTFLIYNRAWSGTREYRLRFTELLIHLNLQEHCKTSINPIEPELGVHYETYQFSNPTWRPSTVLENFFPSNTVDSHYSADFDIEDYEATDIEVVLETLFDDDRLHLTEKSLRPIACAQPFILVATHGSLEYLRSYGFKTFGDVWDESYDLVEDPAERLIQIAELMKYISNWTPDQRERNMVKAQAIADYNRQHFFSQTFFNQIIVELQTNLQVALLHIDNNNTGNMYLNRIRQLWNIPEMKDYLESYYSSQELDQLMHKAQSYGYQNGCEYNKKIV